MSLPVGFRFRGARPLVICWCSAQLGDITRAWHTTSPGALVVTPERSMFSIQRYQERPSAIDRHERLCCRRALSWLRAKDIAQSYSAGELCPPLWLRDQFSWGPMRWPIWWCSVPIVTSLDCGALAAIAVQIFKGRGETTIPVQLVMRYPRHAGEQWAALWDRSGARSDWIAGDLVYHEAAGVLNREELSIWDPTANRWLVPAESGSESFGTVVSLRVQQTRAQETDSRLFWRGSSILLDEWTYVFPID